MAGGRRFRVVLQILVVLLVVGGLAALAIYVDSGPGPIVYRVEGMEQAVVADGRLYDWAELHKLLESVEAAAKAEAK